MNIGSIRNNKTNNNKINVKENKEQNKYKSAFSLIELSIVLIIIGLLVAGVTGGKSLIDSAKTRALMNEVNSYKQAVYSFYAANERLPGDLNNDGRIGYCYGMGCRENSCLNCANYIENYTTSSFSEPYNIKSPNYASAPFIDLYLDGLIDFKPDENNPTGGAGVGVPYSKVYKTIYYPYFTYIYNTSLHPFQELKKSVTLLTFLAENPYRFTAKSAKLLDEKYDDGIYNAGTIFGSCNKYNTYGGGEYDDAIANGKDCNSMSFKVWEE